MSSLEERFDSHEKWLKHEGGERLVLLEQDLEGVNIRDRNLSQSQIQRCNLANANIINVNLSRSLLTDCDFTGVNFSHTNLHSCDLSGSRLKDNILRETIGNKKEVKSFQLDLYSVSYTWDRIQFRCQNYALGEWLELSEDFLNNIDVEAPEWRTKWKELLVRILEFSPANSTEGR